MKIDLRSDTVTIPTPAMLNAIYNAKVGDDVYKEDPSVNALEDYVANLFGKKSALYFPTGSMANQAAIKLHTNPGEQLICDKWGHVYNYEGGGVSFNSGVSCKLVDGSRGKITADLAEKAINPPDFYHSPKTSLVCVENTTNKGGGACYELDELKAIHQVCKQHGLGYHLDGARIANAIIAKKQDPKEFGKLFDTITICLSKGLGAPMGTVLVGDEAIMQNAMRVRKVLGGGMRQVGFMAAAGLFALQNQFERLEEDHKKANELGEMLASLNFVEKVESVETNIVIFYLDEKVDAEKFMHKLDELGIRISDMGEGKMRMVTHLDYTEIMHDFMLENFRKAYID
ncbi:threonine aldolase family protein [Psychroflexus planctonicus]|uniref:Threonine aldolase n=1 Tax=Psychroflexus planctonicus TaxID=1526575 RepID=A0ABQ1SFH0_9FLAO|nr:GntG family PLP-dependent aldolase [Psychroflexus planctonicus]GGE30285.1 threonine aldolase [Psychroflexus planctonicus]